MPDPSKGERRRFGDQIGEWDGQQWNKADATIGATPTRTWTDTAVDALPAIGGAVGGILGTVSGIPTAGLTSAPAAIAGASILGAGGEAAKQLINRVRGKDTPQTSGAAALGIGEQGAIQGALEGAGQAVMPVLAKTGEAVYRGYLKPSLSRVNLPKAARIVRTAIEENLPVTAGGLKQADAVITQLKAKVDSLLASAPGRTVSLPEIADDVRAWAKRAFDRPGRDPADYQKALAVADRIDKHPSLAASGSGGLDVELPAANQVKRDLQASANDKFGVPGVSAEVATEKYASASARRAVEQGASGLSDASGQGVGALNMRESKLIDVARALERATGREGNLHKLYGARALVGAAAGSGEFARTHDPYAAAATALASQLALSPAIATRAAILAVKIGERVPGTVAADAARAAVQAALEAGQQAEPNP